MAAIVHIATAPTAPQLTGAADGSTLGRGFFAAFGLGKGGRGVGRKSPGCIDDQCSYARECAYRSRVPSVLNIYPLVAPHAHAPRSPARQEMLAVPSPLHATVRAHTSCALTPALAASTTQLVGSREPNFGGACKGSRRRRPESGQEPEILALSSGSAKFSMFSGV